ncbi:MAG: transcriptional regulator PpsR [Pseudomonadota bacterium]
MEQKLVRPLHKPFSQSSRVFQDLGADTVAALASIGADITMIVTSQGDIVDVAYADESLDRYDLDDWVGRKWTATVTPECREKIEELLDENAQSGNTRRRQVNHPTQGLADLPIEYSLLSVEGLPYKIAIGDDLRRMSQLQQQLVKVQVELESEYRRIREAESRYRTIFHKADLPIAVVDGDNYAIVDLNLSATNFMRLSAAKVIGKPIHNAIHRESRSHLEEAIDAARHGGSRQHVRLRLNDDLEVQANVEPYRENGRSNVMVTFQPADSAKQHASDMTDAIALDSFPEALVIINRDGTIVSPNERFLDLIHVLNRSLLIDRNLNTWLGASAVDLQVLLTRVKEEGQVRQFSTMIRDEIGTTTPVLVSAARYEGDDKIGVVITENQRREAQFSVAPPSSDHGASDFSQLVGRVPLKELIREAVDVIEKLCIEAALRQTDNNRASAADMLGLSRQSLYIKLKRHNLEDFGSDS